jgi:UDPglucose 6-dehydrogenase
MENPFIIDGRNCHSLIEAEEANVEYLCIGRRDILSSLQKEKR